jgi:polynucleotide 5'-hydroxyl-kinase GRC3/NOL9
MTDEIGPGEDWDKLYEVLLKNKGTALILGMSDVGKSTLVRYLIKRFSIEGTQLSLVDSDIGQSSLGLPGTVSMKVFREKMDHEVFSPERMSFIGTVNPAKAIPSLIQTTNSMVEICRKETELILVDTTGLVSGAIGRTIKRRKIRKIRPEWIVAVQKKDELEHILHQCEPERIMRIRRSPEAKARSREVRIRYRARKFESYFYSADSEYALRIYGPRWFLKARPYIPAETDFHEGLIIGLNRNNYTEGLGLVEEIDDGMIVIKSPLKSIQRIRTVILGDIILTPL